MAAKKAKAEIVAATPPPPPSLTGARLLMPSGVADMRTRMASQFDKSSVPDPLDLGKVDVISSGSFCLDLALGIGGYPRGRITTFAGPQHAGKTALALLGAASAQRQIEATENRRAVVAIIDTEHAHSNSLAELVGCDTSPDTMIVFRPIMAEDALMMTMGALGYASKDKGRTWALVGQPADVVLFDSWAGTATEGVGLAELARIGAAWLPTLAAYVNRSNALMFICNHIREKPGVMFGNPEYEPGGHAIQHARSVATLVHRTDVQRDANKMEIAHDLKVDIKKNKLAPPFKRAFLRLHYTMGFDRCLDLVRFFDAVGKPLKESPSSKTFEYKSVRAVGEDNFVEALRWDQEAFASLVLDAQEIIFNG
jgi:recombination protein RecA